MLYMINNSCDDTTRRVMKLSDNEYKTLLRFIKKNNSNLTYYCQPTIEIYKFKKKSKK